MGAAALLLLLGFLPGCGGSPQQPPKDAPPQAQKSSPTKPGKPRVVPAKPEEKPFQPAPQAIPAEPLTPPQAVSAENPPRSKTAPLAGLAAQAASEEFRLPELDENRIKTAGIAKAEGRYLTLYHDLEDLAAGQELTTVFDAAVPQWLAYFELPAEKVAGWKVVGCVMRQKERFAGSGLYPADLPDFPNGFSRGSQFWLFEQPTAYYRRHLLLHEGTHAFMVRWLGGAGPPWYMEGMAELFGTHRWQDGKLQLLYTPKHRDEAPDWGRVRIIKDDFAASKGMQLPEIFRYDVHAHLRNEPYGWCWGATTFFEHHPRWGAAFRALRKETKDRSIDFSKRFYENLKPDWAQVATEWQLFVARIDYGYDVGRSAVVYKPAQSLPEGGGTVGIVADRGWQASGFAVEAGKKYRLTATGLFELARKPKPWPCEAGGVTLEYYRGHPVGMLLAAVANDSDGANNITPLLQPAAIGLGREFTCDKNGMLFLSLNIPPATLEGNPGQVRVELKPMP